MKMKVTNMSLVTPDVKIDETQIQTAEEVTMEKEEVTTQAAEVQEPVENVPAPVEQPQAQAPTTVTERTQASVAALMQEAADEGFEGLEINAFSFDRIKLHHGKFLLGDDETDLGTSFRCQIMGSRASFIVSQDQSEDSEMFYSYDKDGSTLTDGSSSKEILDKWLEDGYGTPEHPLVIKQYMEATAMLVDREDEHEGSVVMLQIPPSSRSRFGGLHALAKMQHNTNLGGVIIEATVGAKVGEGKKAFTPWNAKIVRKA